MIVVRLQGGLGNQLFQYSAARRLAHVHDAELVIEDSYFTSRRACDSTWQYELDHFNVALRRPSETERRSFLSYCKSPWYIIRRMLPLPGHYRYVPERHFHFAPDILDLPDDVFLDGYWQSEKYFSDVHELIRSELRFKDGMSPVEREIAGEISRSNAVSIHVRRGDYVSNAKAAAVHGVCTPDYYRHAIENMEIHLESPFFFIFSDDHEWAERNVAPWCGAHHMICRNTGAAFRDLRLMSLCKHNIVANSSFSWWGAWLNSNVEKRVVAPKNWFLTNRLDTRDLLPPGWIRL